MNIKLIAPHKGVLIALGLMSAWLGLLSYLLLQPVDYASPLCYLYVLLQTHLYTGIFITAHDAMHGTVSANKKLNHWIGRLCALLFAFNFYDRLNRKHHLHHRFVATGQDPDFYPGPFWVWYYHFARQYITIWQLLLMALAFNLLSLLFAQENVVLYWMLPSVLSTFQLFYFGTYLPHRGEHGQDNVHKSRSQPQNHLWAFISCYFFGYHYEHHNSPATPWWMLYREKEKSGKP